MDRTEPDYNALVQLFQQERLVLQTGMTLPTPVAQALEIVTDEALGFSLATLPRCRAVELTNREALMRGAVPFIAVLVEGEGQLSLPAYELRMLQTDEIVERYKDAFETLHTFLYTQDSQMKSSLHGRNVAAWQHVDVSWVKWYRGWLAQYFDAEEEQRKLEVISLYCRLVVKDGHAVNDELSDILAALSQERVKPRGRSRVKSQK